MAARRSRRRSFGQILRQRSGRYQARYTGPDTALHTAPSTFETIIDAEGWLTDERRLISPARGPHPTGEQRSSANRSRWEHTRKFG